MDQVEQRTGFKTSGLCKVDSDFWATSVRIRTFTATTLALFLIPSLAMARTWHIAAYGPSDAPSVQAGIDSAASGDTILVGIGTYFETINFKGKNVVVKSAEGPEQTFLNGSGKAGRVVTFNSGESRATVLEGFTITGGEGGVLIRNSEPSVSGNSIIGNRSPTDGGGIGCDGDIQIPPFWSPLIQSNKIVNNQANNLGGGVLFANDMIPDLIDNYIAENEAEQGDGGGVYYENVPLGGIPLVRGNLIEANLAGDHGGGIYVAQIGSGGPIEIEISHNLIWKNYAKGSFPITPNSGGGIWLWETIAWVHNNTIVQNTGDGPTDGYGGGIVIERVGSPLIEKNIVAFSEKGGGIWCDSESTPTIRNNFAWQNIGGDGVGTCSDWWQSEGNVIDNPYFCDMAGGDFRVASNSGVITHPAGPLGAFPIPGCGPVSILPSTWGTLKAKYRDH